MTSANHGKPSHHKEPYDSRSLAMKSVFISAYDLGNYGARWLISQVKAHGHEAHVIQFKKLVQQTSRTLPQNAPPSLYYQDGAYVVADPAANPITNIEQALLAERLSLLNPDVICFSQCSVFDHLFPLLGSIAHRACPRAFQVVAGQGPTRKAEFYLQHRADAVIRGEAEDALVDLLNALSHGLGWRGIANIACMDQGTLRINAARPRETNLSRYPIPWHGRENTFCIDNNSCHESTLCEADPAGNANQTEGLYHCLTSRGGMGAYAQYPDNRCETSDNAIYAENTMRFRTLEHVFAELHEIKQLGARFICISDNCFTRPHKELHSFLDRYHAEINIPFHANFYPQQLLNDQAIIKKAVHAGCSTFSFKIRHDSAPLDATGLEQKPNAKQYGELFHTIQSLGGNVAVHMIGAKPQQSPESARGNLNFIAQIPYDASEKANILLKIFYPTCHPDAVGTTTDPDIHTAPDTLADFACNSLLVDIRRMTSQSQFLQIMQNASLVRSPELLYRLRTHLQNDAYNAYIFDMVRELRHQKVYYWGCGEIYTMRKHLFSQSLPQAILVDTPYSGPDCVNNIPVVHPDTVLTGAPLPIIIFSNAGVDICRRIKTKYPQYFDDNIIICKL